MAAWRLQQHHGLADLRDVYNDGRLYLGGAIANRFDACVSNGIVGGTVNFAPTDQYGVVAGNNAISYTFNSNGVNPILWMEPDLQGIKAGTQAGEWLIQAPTAGPIAPANITARNVTNHGSTNIQPVRTEHTTVFIQRFAEKLLEYFPDVFSGKFSAPNLADKAAAHHPQRRRGAGLYVGGDPDHLGPRSDGSLVRHHVQAQHAGDIAGPDLLRMASPCARLGARRRKPLRRAHRLAATSTA